MKARRSRLPAEALKDPRGFVRRSSPLFTVRFRSNDLSYPRCAVIVGAKVDRRAVRRNRLKRQLREMLRVRRQGRDIIVTVTPAAKSASRSALRDELERLLA